VSDALLFYGYEIGRYAKSNSQHSWIDLVRKIRFLGETYVHRD